MPYKSPANNLYDSGEFRAILDEISIAEAELTGAPDDATHHIDVAVEETEEELRVDVEELERKLERKQMSKTVSRNKFKSKKRHKRR